jgi:hypothetical protein
MTAGLPGAAIGGLFYLVSALLMPVRETARMLRDREAPRRWRLVARQTAIAGGILVAIWAVGRGLGWLLLATRPDLVTQPAARMQILASEAPSVVRTGAFAVSFGTLIAVLAAIRILAWMVRRRAHRPAPVVELHPTHEDTPSLPRARTGD